MTSSETKRCASTGSRIRRACGSAGWERAEHPVEASPPRVQGGAGGGRGPAQHDVRPVALDGDPAVAGHAPPADVLARRDAVASCGDVDREAAEQALVAARL